MRFVRDCIFTVVPDYAQFLASTSGQWYVILCGHSCRNWRMHSHEYCSLQALLSFRFNSYRTAAAHAPEAAQGDGTVSVCRTQ